MPINDLQLQTNANPSEILPPEGRGRTVANASIVDVRRVLFKRKYLIIAIVGVAVVASIFYAKTRIPLYEAAAILEIDPSRSQSMGLGEALGGSFDQSSTALQTDVVRLYGESLIFRAVGELGLQHRGPFPDAFKGVTKPIADDSLNSQERVAIVSAVKGGLTVSIIPKTSVIRVSYRYRDPTIARDVVNALLGVFMARSVEDRLLGTQQATEMLSSQMDELKRHAADAQRELSQYQAGHNFIASEADNEGTVNLTVDALKILNQQLAEAQADMIVKQARLHMVQSANPDSVLAVAPTSALQALRTEENDAKAKLAQLTTKYGPGYPQVHQLQAEISEVDKSIAAESNNVTRRVREEYDTSAGTVQAIQRRLDDQMQQAFKLNSGAADYAVLREDAESSSDLYNTLRLKLKESSVTAALDAASFSVIDHAVIRPTPVEPNARRLVMTGSLAGLLFAVFLAFGLEALDDTLQTSEDVESNSKLHSLGAIPHFDMQDNPQKELVPGEYRVSPRLITIHATESLAAESFRVIRSAILLSSVESDKNVILVTSAFMGEGKSTLSTNLAVVLAQRGARVLLVDTDLRRHTLSAIFGLQRPLTGLSNILGRLEEGEPYVQPIPSIPNLTLLPAGIRVPNPAELLASSRMASLIAQWKENYDHVVLDSAPILMVSDSLSLAAQADGVVLVIRSGVSRKKALLRSFELLVRSSAKVWGAVVNDVDLKMENYYTYSYKGYGYGYTGYNSYTRAYGDKPDDEEYKGGHVS
jgi:capsular exopolysaccharide synthesis family protein